MSNDTNGPTQEPSAGPWVHRPAESPPQGGAPGQQPPPGQEPPPGWNVPRQADPSASPAWPAEAGRAPVPGSPAPGGWQTAAPVSGQPTPYGTPQTPQYGTPQQDQYGTPQQEQYGTPQQSWTSYQPVSAQPGPSPQSGAGSPPWPQPASPAADASGQSWSAQSMGLDDVGGPAWKPRIEPSPPQRGRFLPGLLVGLLVGLVVLAPAGYFAGDALFGKGTKPEATATGKPSPSSTTLPPYEARQAQLNQAKFDGDLAAMAQPWLPYMSGCVSSNDPGARPAPRSEVARVTCELGDMTIFFDEFKTPEDRNQELLIRKQQNSDAQQLTPGAAAPTHIAGASGNNGDYIEYAFKHSTQGAPTYAGIWWDRDGAPLVTARIEVPWSLVLNEKWEPLRNIWQRHG